ncbi:chorismate-binding protein [Aphanothece sacrum FPU3]|nr:chorismate-binding protein [Aphanothece sacrum FPU3]
MPVLLIICLGYNREGLIYVNKYLTMTHATDLTTLVRWMSADFSNQEQAFANPPFYAHIRVCMRPLPISIFPEFSLFLEQAYDYMLNVPIVYECLNLR